MTQEPLSQRINRCAINIRAVREELRQSSLQLGLALDIVHAEVERQPSLGRTLQEQIDELNTLAQIVAQRGD